MATPTVFRTETSPVREERVANIGAVKLSVKESSFCRHAHLTFRLPHAVEFSTFSTSRARFPETPGAQERFEARMVDLARALDAMLKIYRNPHPEAIAELETLAGGIDIAHPPHDAPEHQDAPRQTEADTEPQ